MKTFFQILVLILLSALFGCTAKRYIPEGKQLFTGHDVQLDSLKEIQKGKKLIKDMERLLNPAPNFSVLGWRPKLWMYFQIDSLEKDSGFKHWLKYGIGEPPVYVSMVNQEDNAATLEAWLENKGFFDAVVTTEVPDSGKTSKVIYHTDIHPPYIISQLRHIKEGHKIDTILGRTFFDEASLVRLGCPYGLEALKLERVRLDDTLKNNGYFYFNPDYLLYKLDTAEQGNNTNLYVTLKQGVPEKALIPYRIQKVTVHLGYDLTDTTGSFPTDTLNGYHIVYHDSSFRAKPILTGVTIRPGSIYSRRQHDRTLGRLISMGAFRFVDVNFTPVDTTSPTGVLNADIYLSPVMQHTLRSEVKFVSKSNNFTGPGLEISYRNRNLLKGAELLVVNLGGGFETQLTSNKATSGLNSYEFGLQNDLYLPRSVSLIKGDKNRSKTMPRTHFGLGGRYLSRVNYFSLFAFNGRYGYQWRPRSFITSELSPLAISYVNVNRVSNSFQEVLNANPVLARSFEKQFILGPKYSLIVNNQPESRKPITFYFAFSASESGLITGMTGGAIGGIPVGQFVKTDVDFRQYWRVGRESKFVTRIFAGFGIPYGNSRIMPYMEQYFAGGSNSLRGFPARTVGPGSYTAPDSLFTNIFLDQSGDIKLEGNIEYRFPISSLLKGAVFIDAGNVWLANVDPSRPGAKFDMADITSEIAASYGFGLRIDVTFFVLRFDLGIPWIRPYAANETPIPHQQNGLLGDMVLNIAIGYPF